MRVCFMSSRRVFVRIFAVLSATVLMYFKQNSFYFLQSQVSTFVLRKPLSTTLHCLAMTTSKLWVFVRLHFKFFCNHTLIHVSENRLIGKAICACRFYRSWNFTHQMSYSETRCLRTIHIQQTVESTTFTVCFWGISRLRSAFTFILRL